MKTNLTSIYRSPGSQATLALENALNDGDEIVSGFLVESDGIRFPIEFGIPDFTWPQQLSAREIATIKFYDARADVYDKYLPLTFSTFGESEVDVRNAMVDRLQIGPGKRVLEIGAGTGRDSEIIATRLGGSGELFCQDIARSMLERNRDRLKAAGLMAHFAIANSSHLPFADNVFDGVFQFGGVGEFVDIAGFFREIVRVSKVGGRVVVGDESMPPWLRQTTFARILATTNPQFNAPLPLEHLPVEARNVCLHWIIGGTFYLIDFTVGEGEPPADFDFVIPGTRGGTHRTRYLGQLEGVKLETKDLAYKALEKLGLSMHDWLDDLVQREARRVLDAEGPDG
jgi:ubiquinone/menaquinone biosynthesis C-methylase UbiE